MFRFFLPCDFFSSSADASEDDGVKSGGDSVTFDSFLVALTFLNCPTTFSWMHFAIERTKRTVVSALLAKTFMKDQGWAHFSVFWSSMSSGASLSAEPGSTLSSKRKDAFFGRCLPTRNRSGLRPKVRFWHPSRRAYPFRTCRCAPLPPGRRLSSVWGVARMV